MSGLRAVRPVVGRLRLTGNFCSVETSPSPYVDVVIVGAGFSGLYMLHRARDVLGLSARVYETGEGVGGTWYWNRYPGARCDSESFIYSYSFSEELQQEWVWSTKYPEQPEILRYLDHVADRFDLRRDIRFGTRVVRATLQGDDCWEVATENDEVVTCQFLISAVGCLSAANIPDISGLEQFGGEWCHTGAWPREGVDFTGKRVAVVGTGSTGIQAVPVLAAQAEHLCVFQRTPQYTVPARNAPLTAEQTSEIKAHYGAIRRKCRNSFAGFPYDPTDKSATEVTAAERLETYERLWSEEGGFKFLYGSYKDLLLNKSSNDTAAEFIRSKIREIVHDPAVAEVLVPTDYPYGTKRPPIDTDYYKTFNRSNVTLVNLRETPIVEATATGLRTTDAQYDFDIIVFATGFDAMTGSLLKIDIRGRDDQSLQLKWDAGPTTYLGLMVAGFPNLFTVTGPGSPSVLANMPVAIEQHVEWIADCISYMRERGLRSVEAMDAAEKAWVEHVREVAEVTLFPFADSWYLGANIPGKKRVFMPYVGGFIRYREHCDSVAASGYRGVAFAGNDRD